MILFHTHVIETSPPILMGTTPIVMYLRVTSICNINQNNVNKKSRGVTFIDFQLSISGYPNIALTLDHSIWKSIQLDSSFPDFSYPHTWGP